MRSLDDTKVTVDAAANPEWNKSHRTLEAKQTPRTHGTVLSRSFYQLYLWKTTSSQISSNMMYLTLVVVILSGVALGVCIPIVVNYYYEEVNTPPWLRDLVEELSRRDSRREEDEGDARAFARSRSTDLVQDFLDRSLEDVKHFILTSKAKSVSPNPALVASGVYWVVA
eukprot:g12870.t1